MKPCQIEIINSWKFLGLPWQRMHSAECYHHLSSPKAWHELLTVDQNYSQFRRQADVDEVAEVDETSAFFVPGD
jgi:hypothetical protein